MVRQSAEDDATALALDSLVHGFRHLSAEGGAMMAQAAAVSLEQQGHRPGVHLAVDGAFSATFALSWPETVTDAVRRFWNDLDEATEQGAYAVAILVTRALTGCTILERSRRGTGFDWWLGTEDNLFQHKARLEVSGILHGSMKRINGRVKARMEQTKRSDDLTLPVYVVVVEFGNPRAKVVQR
jgi:hypothetical protein